LPSGAAGQVESFPWELIETFLPSTAEAAGAGDVAGVANRAVDIALELTGATVAFIALVDEAGNRDQVYSRTTGSDAAPAHDEIDRLVAATGADDVEAMNAFRGQPLHAAGRRIGMIGVAGAVDFSAARLHALAAFADQVAAAIEIAGLRRRRQETVDALINLRFDRDRSEKLRLLTEERAQSAIRLARAHELAVEALLAVSVHARAGTDMPEFYTGLTAGVAALVGAERVLFWQLDKNSSLTAVPGAKGVDAAMLAALPSLRALPEAEDAVSQAVHGDLVLRSIRSDDGPRSDFDRVLHALDMGDGISASWRAGDQRLGMISAYGSLRPDGFSVEDAWVLHMAGLAAGLALQLKQAEADLNRTIERLENVDEARKLLLRNMSSAVEKARKRLAHELHDDALQKLTAAELQLKRVNGSLDGNGEMTPIEEAGHLLVQVEEALRKLLFELRPPALEETGGFEKSIRERAAFLHSVTGIKPELELDSTDSEPAEIKALVFRQVAEALTNVEKHAAATRVKVVVGRRDGGIRGEVSDNGRGFVVTERDHLAGHLGLMALKERALLAGGWCVIKSQPGAGTSVEFWIPTA